MISIIASDNLHATETRQGLQVLKKLTSDLNGWDFTLDQDNVKLYNKKLDDTSQPPLVRGDTILTVDQMPPGCTPLAVATVATLPGCRKIWDDRYDQSEVKDYYTRYESLFWVKLKAPWPISPRDFAATSIRDNGPNITYTSMISVQDDKIPTTSGCVRGNLLVSGWKFIQQESSQQIGITYINQVDLAGSIPAAFLKKLLQQIPLCAGKVRDYVVQFGFAPTAVIDQEGVEFKGEEFDHDKKKYTLELMADGGGGGAAEILCSERMYPNGVQVVLKGDGLVVQEQDEFKNPRIMLKDLKGSMHVIIEKK